MIDMQDQNFSPDGSPRSEQDPGLRVQVRLAEPIKDLRTRDEKLTQFPEKIDYLAKNLVFELRFTLKDLTDAQRTQLGISAEDMKFLNEAVPNSSDFSEILKSTKLTKEQLERINEIVGKSTADGSSVPGFIQNTLKTYNGQMQTDRADLKALESQTTEQIKVEASTLRASVIDEIRSRLPADKQAEFDSSFKDRTTPEATKKLVEFVNQFSSNAQSLSDKYVAADIQNLIGILVKCDKQIADSNRLPIPVDPLPAPTPLEPQTQRKQWEQNYYQDKMVTYLEGIAAVLSPAGSAEYNKGTYKDQSERISSLLVSLQNEMNSPKNVEWKKSVLEKQPELAKFFDAKTSKLEVTEESLAAIDAFVTKAKGDPVLGANNQMVLENKPGKLREIFGEYKEWMGKFPNGTPDPAVERAERRGHEFNYYQDNISKTLESFASMVVSKDDFTKIQQGSYADKSEKISALIKAIKETINLSSNAEWKASVLRDQANGDLSKFFDDKSDKPVLTTEALRAIELFASRPASIESGLPGIAERNSKLAIARELRQYAEEKTEWEKIQTPN